MTGGEHVRADDSPIPAMILAGGGPDDEVAAATGTACKALANLNGRPLIGYVIDALRASETVSEITVVEGPGRQVSLSNGSLPEVPIVSAQGDQLIDTFTAAARACDEGERLLIVTADLPLLTSESVDGFVRSCQETPRGLSYAIVQAEAFEEAFPGRGKTTVPLREGRFAGGNLAIVTRRFVLEGGPAIARTFDRRKSVVKLAWMFGFRFIVRLVTGRLCIEDLERRGQELVGTTVAAVPVPWPEIGFDVDHRGDLELAGRYLRERRGE